MLSFDILQNLYLEVMLIFDLLQISIFNKCPLLFSS